MAQTTIRRDQRLPPYCMYCGAPAAATMNKRFADTNWFALVFNIGSSVTSLPTAVSLPVDAAAREIGDNAAVIPISLCQKHQGHWMRRGLAAVVIVLLWIAALFVAMMLSLDMIPCESDWLIPVWIGFCVDSIVSITLLIALTKNTIRAKRIRYSGVLLAGLSPRFVEMLAEPVVDAMSSRSTKDNPNSCA